MGIDLLDINFRLEKRFGIKIERSDFDLFAKQPWSTFTAGFMYDLVCKKLQEAGKPIPRSCWNGVRLVIAQALGVSPDEIRRDSQMIDELGMS